MKLFHEIPWFNPRQMDDATILALSTGQDDLLQAFLESVQKRLSNQSTGHHWLITGPRGGGKSFFLRFVQAQLNQTQYKHIKFALLPEEQKNIDTAHAWLNAVHDVLARKANGLTGRPSAWNASTTDEQWSSALKTLLDIKAEDLLIIAVENFDDLLAKAFKDPVDSSRLRTLLENEPQIMLLATAVDSSFDENYNQRLFRQFEHHIIQPWKPLAHRAYLSKRAQLEGKIPDLSQLARIDAYSRYTGGNARVASVLASLIMEKQDPLLASADLAATLDKMTDYYRAQLDRIPDRSFKLFDALLQGGEPCSQTELATRVDARQSDISKAFIWLVDYGFIAGVREKGQKAIRYQVSDRLFSQFYRMRYLQIGQNTQLTILADLLADTIEFSEKWRYAERYLNEGYENEARTMVELGLKERNVEINHIPENLQSTQSLVDLGIDWENRDNLPNALVLLKHDEKHFPTDETFAEAITKARGIAVAIHPFAEELSGAQLAALIEGSLSLCPVEKHAVYCAMAKENFSQFQWTEFIRVFEKEKIKLSDLEKEYHDDINTLKNRLELGKKYPLSISLDNFSTATESKVDFKQLSRIDTLVFQMHCAAKASSLWFSHKRWQEAEKSLKRCIELTTSLYNDYYSFDQILATLSSLQTYSGSKIDKSAKIDFLIGQNLLALNHPEAAIKSFQKARNIALQHKKTKHAITCLGQIAWCLAIIRDHPQSITTHQQVLDEKKEQGYTENISWNIGQIARHKVALEGMKAAWSYLDKQALLGEKNLIDSAQQLADAIYDCVKEKSETEAFSLTCQLLNELKKRPQYPVEANLRALWIGMVDMGVPFIVLRDLVAEIPSLLDEKLSTLLDILIAWLDDLELSPLQRIEQRKTLNPDLATTLEALGKKLSVKAKARLHLLQYED